MLTGRRLESLALRVVIDVVFDSLTGKKGAFRKLG